MAERLPLHTVHAALGAVFASPWGWELPFSYGDPAAEYRAVRRAVGLVDRSCLGVLEVTGRDRVSFLQGMLTNDLKVLTPGQGCPAAFLDAHGKVQALLTVLALEDRVLLTVRGGAAEKTRETLDKFLISEKASFKDVTAETARFMLAGPGAGTVVERLTGAAPLPMPSAHVERAVAGLPVQIVTGDGETGEAEAWLYVPTASGEAVWNAALEAGKPLGLSPVGVTALEVLRVEAGVPWYGQDVDDTVLLPEIPLEAYVSYTKGCYIGQEVVARIKYRGHVNRSLTGLTLDGDRVPGAGAVVVADNREVGWVTSAVRSFSLDRPIALAYVRREFLEPGTALTVRDNGMTLAAHVTALPFSRPGSP